MRNLQLSILLVFVILVTNCKSNHTNRATAPLKVDIAIAEQLSVHDRLEVASHIEGLRNAVIQPRVEGFLSSINFEGGMPIKEGDLLFTIDPATLSTALYEARAALESAKAEELLAQRNYQRAVPLAKIDAISQSDLDQYRATYKAAKASSKSAEESLRSAEINMGYTTIYSPLSGIAAKSTASVGDYIGLGTAESLLTTISQLDTITVDIAIPTERYFEYRTPSQTESYDNSALLSDIRLILTDSSTFEQAGTYHYTKKSTPANSSSVVIVAKFANPDLKLKDGMFARVRCNIGAEHTAIVVPQEAISQMQGINTIWVVGADSTAAQRRVTLGEHQGSMWEVTHGIAPGDKVVTAGGMKLRNKQKVTPIKKS